jgi:hypothetical protein
MQPAAPGGISGLLAKPGITQALLAFGSSMLAESDRPGGSLGGALGRSLPSGMQAYGQGQQEAEIDKLMANAPPEMQQLLRALPAQQRVPALMQLMQAPTPVAVGANERLVNPETGEAVVDVVPEVVDPVEGFPPEAQLVLWGMGVDPAAATPEQRQAAMARYEEMQASGRGPLVNVNTGGQAKQLDTYYAGVYGNVNDAGRAAPGKIEKLNRLGELLDAPGVYQGTAGAQVTALKRLGVSLGMDIEGVAEAEAAQSIGREMALELRNPAGGAGMPGAMSDKDREFLESMVPNLSKTPEGNRMIVEASRRVAQRDMEVAEIVREYAATHGGVDAGVEAAIQQAFQGSDMFADLRGGTSAVYERYPNIRPRGR